MEQQQPSTIGNLQESLSNTYNNAAQAASSLYNNASESASSLYNNASESLAAPLATASSSIQDSFNNTMSEFSSKSVGEASTEFLASNSLIARFAFVFLVVIFFMFFLRLGIYLVGYFTQPSNNPYLVNGMITGSTALRIKQDPKDTDAVTLMRSNNKQSGIEFTWSTWLYITDLSGNTASSSTQPTYQHIFNKGDNNYNASGIANTNNAPGLYLLKSNNPTLHVVMNNVTSDNSMESINVDNLPLKKWFHVAIRMQNKNMDVYINGIITGRLTFTNVPKQNYQDVYICQNGGFSGSLSNLRYYDSALNIFDINNIVLNGPNTKPSSVSDELSSASTSGYTYLSSSWYTNKM